MKFWLLIFCLILPLKIHADNSVRVQREAKIFNFKHQVRPKKKGKINLQKFSTNDAFFKPSLQIPLEPSLAQRSGAAIHYAQPLVAAKNLFHYDNLPNFQDAKINPKSKKNGGKRVKPRIPFVRKRPKKPKNRQDLFKYSRGKIPFKPQFQYDTRGEKRKKEKNIEEEDTELKVTIVFGEEVDQNNEDKVMIDEANPDIYKYYEESKEFDPLPKYETRRPKTSTVPPKTSTISPKTTTNPPKITTTISPRTINYLSKPIKITTPKTRTIKNDFRYYENTEKYYQRITTRIPKPKTYTTKTYPPKTYPTKTYPPKTYTPKTYPPKTYTPKTYTPKELQFYADYEAEQLPTYDPDQIYDHHDYFNYDHYDKSSTSPTATSFFDNFFNDNNEFGFGQKFMPPSFNSSDFFGTKVYPTFGIMSTTTLPTESPKMSTTLPSERPKKARRTTQRPAKMNTWPSGRTTFVPKTSTFPQKITTTLPKTTTTAYSMFTQRGRGTIFDIPEQEFIPNHMFYPSTDRPQMTSSEKNTAQPDVRYRKRSTARPKVIPAPPTPPPAPSIKSLRMLRRQRKLKQKLRVKKRKRKKKQRIRKKELKEKQAAIKRSLTFQYKVLDFVNQTAFWTTLVSVIGFALAMQ